MDFTPFIETIAKYGLWVVFAGLWYLERGERKELQKERNEFVERVLNAMQEGTTALREMRHVIRGERRD